MQTAARAQPTWTTPQSCTQSTRGEYCKATTMEEEDALKNATQSFHPSRFWSRGMRKQIFWLVQRFTRYYLACAMLSYKRTQYTDLFFGGSKFQRRGLLNSLRCLAIRGRYWVYFRRLGLFQELSFFVVANCSVKNHKKLKTENQPRTTKIAQKVCSALSQCVVCVCVCVAMALTVCGICVVAVLTYQMLEEMVKFAGQV